jgi:hypothetical protein
MTLADPASIRRIAIDEGAVLVRQDPSVVTVLNVGADFVFRRLLDGASKCTLVAELESRFGAENSRPLVDDFIEDAERSLEALLADEPLAAPDDATFSSVFDRQDWPFDEILALGSAAARLRIADDHLAGLMESVYGPAFVEPAHASPLALTLEAAAAADDDYWLRRNGDVSGPFNRHGAFLEIQRALLTAAHAPRHTDLILHASAVMDQAGERSIVLAGGAGSGKSSLAAEFLLQGWRLIADDVAILDAERHELWPLTLPLRLKAGSFARLEARVAEAFVRFDKVVEPSGREVWRLYPEHRNRPPALAPPPAMILFPIYENGAALELARIEPLAALALIVDSGAWFETDEAAMAETVRRIAATPCYSVIFSSAGDVVAAVQDLLRSDGAPGL